MAAHSLKSVQKIPGSLEEVWAFFSDPSNLNNITPEHMKFRVISKHHGNNIYAGQIFEYRLRPLLGIPIYWMTEITHVSEPNYFVDEQRKGPYVFWQHQHHFKAIEGGVEMTDIVHYKNPLGALGNLANGIFVRNKLKQIFEHRFNEVEKKFGQWPGGRQIIIEVS
jgi:ligand-binding SRPBCC domain-containing protein